MINLISKHKLKHLLNSGYLNSLVAEDYLFIFSAIIEGPDIYQLCSKQIIIFKVFGYSIADLTSLSNIFRSKLTDYSKSFTLKTMYISCPGIFCSRLFFSMHVRSIWVKFNLIQGNYYP